MNLGKVISAMNRLSTDYWGVNDCIRVIAEVKASDADEATKLEITGVAQKCMDCRAQIQKMQSDCMSDAMACMAKYNKPENIAAAEPNEDDHFF